MTVPRHSQAKVVAILRANFVWAGGRNPVPDEDYQNLASEIVDAVLVPPAEPQEGEKPVELPADLERVLRDPSIIVPQDAAVFELIAKWANAPSNTASADPLPSQPSVQSSPDPVRAEDDPMPVFVIKAKDNLAVRAIEWYARECVGVGLEAQAREVDLAIAEVKAWRERHSDLCQSPDHKHVPVAVREPGPNVTEETTGA